MSNKKTKREKLEEKYLKARGRSLITSPGSAADTLTQIVSGADRKEIRDFINEVVKNVNDGDLTAPESLLVNQVYTLNRVFHNQITLAHDSKYIDQSQYHADMAFRAQAQCNRTLRTLLEYKNPKRATFIKQQTNLQINQNAEKSEKKVNPANELLEHDHESRLDTRTPEEAIRSDTPLETMGEDERASHRKR